MIQTNKKTKNRIISSVVSSLICVQQQPDIANGMGNIGPAPAHILNGLSSTENFSGRILAGMKQSRLNKPPESHIAATTDQQQQQQQPYTLVPCYKYTTQLNIFLCIRKINVGLNSNEKSWRVFNVLKLASSFYDFYSLKNAQNVFWDMVRAVLIWGSPKRKEKLQKMILKHKK